MTMITPSYLGETIEYSSLHACRSTLEDPTTQKTFVPIGRPIANIEIYILDAVKRPVPIGAVGELHIGGIGLARGYLGRPELTAEKFVANPFRSGEKMYCTGDWARWTVEGVVDCLGRIDNQVKIRGFRIELGEIESIIASHPGVRQNVVIAREDTPGDKRLTAYVVPQKAGQDLALELRAALQGKLPSYMVPSALLMMEALPMSANGKLDRRALPAPATEQPEEKPEFAPRNEAERQMAEVWQDVLGRHVTSVRDDFFDLGGDSLLAVRLVTRIHRSFGKRLPLTTFNNGATIESLVTLLESDQSLKQACLIELQAGGGTPFFCVPGRGGRTLILRSLAARFRGKTPFYGFEAKRLQDIDRATYSIPSMASEYIAEMRKRQPAGPYDIGGLCFGALVALEMAQQLTASGHGVRTLALFDPPVLEEEHSKQAFRRAVTRKLRELPRMGVAEAGHWAAVVAGNLQENLSSKLKMKRHEIARTIAPDQEMEMLDGSTERAVIGEEVRKKYRALPFDGTMSVFLAKGNGEMAHDSTRLGWKGIARGGYREFLVEGGHLTMLQDPEVADLGGQLLQLLEEMRANASVSAGIPA